jgi:hypothetical protein
MSWSIVLLSLDHQEPSIATIVEGQTYEQSQMDVRHHTERQEMMRRFVVLKPTALPLNKVVNHK